MKNPKKINLKPRFQPGDFIIKDQSQIGRIRFVTATIDAQGGQQFDYSAVFPQDGETWEMLRVEPHGEEQGVVNIDESEWSFFDGRSEAEKLAADLEILNETLYKLSHSEAASKLHKLIVGLRDDKAAEETALSNLAF